MFITINYNKNEYKIDCNNSHDISIPYEFNGFQPNFYNVNKGKLEYFNYNGKNYSVSEGASCNVSEITMNIHCTGTHTECVGHLLDDPGDIGMLLKGIIIPAVLITLDPVSFYETEESYHCNVDSNEQVISYKSIKKEFEKWIEYKPEALVIRTNPNPTEKKFYNYTKNIPPFFSNDALRFIKSSNIFHLVVDLPSIDRMQDNGILGNHRIFWGGNTNPKVDVNSKSTDTVTEFAYIPNNVIDGFYFLNIQLPHFVCDAAPSRPILIKSN